ncbi:hypothetical protein PSEUBRA_001192 [Kalmanozyma brasiliensis GHG001]|uniref:uncharacterized protein n=1 Tax=Kalmanozyma brasiliensis (strain GHG001) TaxID=1365824 RepID=UPI0028682336|nr:uncharacterized protein PSEUBRA_001192 [Kalmanozyma brasiliensis GHG001]KAF6766899.1 hypothetical protein PSEUBRA_001192 [Kalmanozyma brasiliensis GHG001]
MTSISPSHPDGEASSSARPIAPSAPILTPTLAADLRLTALTHLLHGTSSAPRTASPPALTRLSHIQSTLSTLSSTSKPLSSLLSDWEVYSDLLHPYPSSSTGSWDATQQISLLLAQQPELQQALSELSAIQLLAQQRGVLDSHQSKTLARAVDAHNPQLTTLQDRERARAEKTAEWNSRLVAVVQAWAQYTEALSRAFVLFDDQLLQLERQMGVLERTSHPA